MKAALMILVYPGVKSSDIYMYAPPVEISWVYATEPNSLFVKTGNFGRFVRSCGKSGVLDLELI